MIVTHNNKPFNFEPNTWKVFLILNKLQKKGPVTPQNLMANMLFERGFGLDFGYRSEVLSSITITDFEKNIYKRIEELKKQELIRGTTHLFIPEENAKISSQLASIRLDSESPLDAMSIINMIIPFDSYSQGTFSPYDESFFSLYGNMGHLQQGILLKISFGGKIYSCLVQVKSNLSELYDKLVSLKYTFERIGVKFLVLEKLPLKPITLFPFFTVASDIIKDAKTEWDKKKFDFNQDTAKEYLEKWFKEYLQARRKISNNVENYSLIDPDNDKPKEIFVFLNKKLDVIAIFYYLSDTEDKIDVKLVEKAPFLQDIPTGDDYPPRDKLIRTRALHAKDLFVTLGDPKAAAITDVGKQIEEFNKKTHEPMFDTSEINKESFENWIKAEIDAKRKLIEFLQFENYHWSRWKKPIKVYASYKLDEQHPNLRRGGHYSIHYENSEKDEIFVHELTKDKKEVDVYGEHIKDYKNFFMSASGDLLSYLMEIKGEYFKSYF